MFLSQVQRVEDPCLDCCTDTAFIGWTPMEVFGGWASSRGGCVNPSSLQPSSWACCFTPRASPDLAPTNVTYFTRPDLTPTAYRLNILGRQSESNSHSFSDLLICNFFSSSHNSSHLQRPFPNYCWEDYVYEFCCLRVTLAPEFGATLSLKYIWKWT